MSDSSTSNELEKTTPSKDEALDFTHRFRDVLESFCDAGEQAAKCLRESHEIDYWQGAGYDSWLEWYETEYEEQIEFLKDLKLSLDIRGDIVQSLADGGLSNRQIAGTLGVNEKTVRNDLKVSRELGAELSAPNHVDAAGQSVEEVGLIEDDESELQVVEVREPTVAEEAQQTWEDDEETEEERKARLDAWLNNISFDRMIIAPTAQIIETDPSEVSPEYFEPRPRPVRPLEVINPALPPPRVKAYDDEPVNYAEPLAPPMKLQKVKASTDEPETKHCKTCACNLLP